MVLLVFFTPKALKEDGLGGLLLIANPNLKLSPYGGSAKNRFNTHSKHTHLFSSDTNTFGLSLDKAPSLDKFDQRGSIKTHSARCIK